MTTTSEPAGAPGAPGGMPAAPPAPAGNGKKVAANWAGALMAIGAIVAGVGTFMVWKKFVYFNQDGSYFGAFRLAGLGGTDPEGGITVANISFNGGKIVIGAAVLGLVVGIVILANKGRLWASILGLVFGLVAGGFAVLDIGADTESAKTLADSAQGLDVVGLGKGGPMISAIGGAVIVVGAVLSLIARKRAQ